MDDHFDTSGVFEISKFDISKFACICLVHIRLRSFFQNYNFNLLQKDFSLLVFIFIEIG